MTHSRIHTDFAALHAALPRLDELSARGSVFYSQPWFENLHAHGLEAAAQTHELLLISDEQGCLPLLDDGSCLHALSNYYSSLYGPMGKLPAGLADALQLIKRPLIDLRPLDTEDNCFQQLKQELASAGYWVDDYFCFGNWHLDVAGRSFADYMAERPSQLLNNLQRGKGKLDKAGPWQIDIQYKNDEALDAAIAAFESVYAKSWKQPEPQSDFIPTLCRMAAQQGCLRLGVLRLAGVPIAAQLWLVHQGTASIYKLAYDQEANSYSAGTVLSAAMFEHAIDIDHVAEVDYLNGDEPYKQDWMSHRRERRGIIAFDPLQWQGIRAAARHWAGRGLRRLRQAKP